MRNITESLIVGIISAISLFPYLTVILPAPKLNIRSKQWAADITQSFAIKEPEHSWSLTRKASERETEPLFSFVV